MNTVPLFPYNHCPSEAAYCSHTKIHFQDFAWKGVPGNAVWALASCRANHCPKVTASDSERTCAQFSTCPPWVHASSQTSQTATCPTETQDRQERQETARPGPRRALLSRNLTCTGCRCRSSPVTYAAFTQPALPRGLLLPPGAQRGCPHSTVASPVTQCAALPCVLNHPALRGQHRRRDDGSCENGPGGPGCRQRCQLPGL